MLTHISQLSHSLHDSTHIITHDFLSFLVCFRFFLLLFLCLFLSANYSIRFLHNRSVFKFALNRFRYQAILQLPIAFAATIDSFRLSSPSPLSPPLAQEKKAHLNFHLHFPMPEQEIAKRKRQAIKSYKYGRDTSPATKKQSKQRRQQQQQKQKQQQRGAFGATAPRPRRVGAFIKMHINFNNCRDQVRRL